ncbi:MAG: hypothetical protein GF390_00630, partial [Candidatus Pacebacteria bacterium]|nr:hypothetical protein [Candidatus Paceibacterota bacterium]
QRLFYGLTPEQWQIAANRERQLREKAQQLLKKADSRVTNEIENLMQQDQGSKTENQTPERQDGFRVRLKRLYQRLTSFRQSSKEEPSRRRKLVLAFRNLAGVAITMAGITCAVVGLDPIELAQYVKGFALPHKKIPAMDAFENNGLIDIKNSGLPDTPQPTAPLPGIKPERPKQTNLPATRSLLHDTRPDWRTSPAKKTIKESMANSTVVSATSPVTPSHQQPTVDHSATPTTTKTEKTNKIETAQNPITEEQQQLREANRQLQKLEEAENLFEFLLQEPLTAFQEARQLRLRIMQEQDPAKAEQWLAAVGKHLYDQRINIVVGGLDAAEHRKRVIDPVYLQLRTANDGLMDQIHILSIGLDGSMIFITIPRDLRVSELEGYTINTATYFNREQPIDADGQPNFYSLELMREILENATGLPIDAILTFNLDAPGPLIDGLFPEGMPVTIQPEEAFSSTVLNNQAYEASFWDRVSKIKSLQKSLLDRANPADRQQFFKSYPDPSGQEIVEFLKRQRVNFPPGKYPLSGEEVLFFLRARQNTTSHEPGSGAGQSTFAREENFNIILQQVVRQIFGETFGSGLNFQNGWDSFSDPMIQALSTLQSPQFDDVRIIWNLGEYQLDPKNGNLEFVEQLELAKFLQRYSTAISHTLGNPTLVGELARWTLEASKQLAFVKINWEEGNLVPNSGKWAIAGGDPTDPTKALEYWKPLRDKVDQALQKIDNPSAVTTDED